MSKVITPGARGTVTVGGVQRSAVVLQGTGSPGEVELRTLELTPDDDTFIGAAGQGVAPIAPAANVADASGENLFVQVHPSIEWVDTEDQLPAGPLQPVNDIDLFYLVRQGSGNGPALFVVDEAQRLVPVTPFPTATLATTTPDGITIPTATDVVLGSVGNLDTLARTFFYPGAAIGSPFAFLWSYDGAGVLATAPGQALRLAVTITWSTNDVARYEFWLQSREGAGAWVDNCRLIVLDLAVLGFLAVDAWSQTGFCETDNTPTTSYRVVVRHDNALSRDIVIESMLWITNTLGVNP